MSNYSSLNCMSARNFSFIGIKILNPSEPRPLNLKYSAFSDKHGLFNIISLDCATIEEKTSTLLCNFSRGQDLNPEVKILVASLDAVSRFYTIRWHSFIVQEELEPVIVRVRDREGVG